MGIVMNHNLQALIKDQLTKYPHAAPEELAMYVAQATPTAEMKSFYAHLLVGACRSAINTHRSGSRHGGPRPKPRPQPKPSPKLEERRTWWAEMLTALVTVAADTRKALGDCTAEDLRYCIKDREEYTVHIQNQTANLRRLLDMLEEQGVTHVRELPEQERWGQAS
jgi:hypothetical protein